ncbi:hypothetical protein GQ43DRAFT_190023 [Delitschia confertaspora ATCC 74209]|uniref:C2H2-type domain-containing protein n=1 Tax=Delitschia confertaspora ATCC 74209 TaxID=1513339 RepID=A0A9P4JGE2_9PLEO|nr:hypothetical protein GQ43DRAFT_190023 [Delitschia confertaspora ATCC 74209]
MDVFQYKDLPQIQVADDSPLNAWPAGYPAQMAYVHPPMEKKVFLFGEEIALGGAGIHSMSNMQRFLHGPEQPPFVHGFLHTKPNFNYGVTTQHYHIMQYQHHIPPFPSPEADYHRDTSPETTSSFTSHFPQNELRPPHMYEHAYGSPDSFAHVKLPYPDHESIPGGAYAPETLHAAGGIDPRDIQYDHDEPEPSVEELERVDNKADLCSYEPEPAYNKTDIDVDNHYHTDSAIGHSLRDPESVHPISPGPEAESSDSDYKPKKTKRRRRSAQFSNTFGSRQSRKSAAHSQKNSSATTSTSNRVTKKLASSASPPTKTSTTSYPNNNNNNNNSTAARPFPCPLALYGCSSSFVSKNEWKRHVSTQHIKLGFWRCDLCSATIDTKDPNSLYHNDFNRKDLFTQHLRRMHAAPAGKKGSGGGMDNGEWPVCEDNITEHQRRCYMSLRLPPPQSSCLFCDRVFVGVGSWDERMEHVGRHLEKERKVEGGRFN